MFIYLAEPGDENVGEWAGQIESLARQIGGQMGNVVFRPVASFSWSVFDGQHARADLQRLNRANRAALDGADLLVAVLPPKTSSRGVPMEIGWASDAGIPVVLLTTERIAGATLFRGNPNVHFAFGVEEAVAWVRRCAAQGGLLPTNHPRSNLTRVENGSLALRYALSDQARSENGGAPPSALTKHYGDDAAFDLYTTQDVELRECQYAMIPCGVRVEFPEGVFGWVVARSSTFPNWGIIVPPGIIDTGWRGEMAVPCWRVPSGAVWTTDADQPYNGFDLTARGQVGEANGRGSNGDSPTGDTVAVGHSPKSPGPFVIPAGTRLAQLVLFPNVAAAYRPQPVDSINDTDRGTRGFGSTGDGPTKRVVDVHVDKSTHEVRM